MIETTEDAFLGGSLQLLQPKSGYRAGADPVLLASAVRARSGESVLELGCGVGVALCCLLHRVPGIHGVGLERDPEMTVLAKQNLAKNQLSADVLHGDIAYLPEELKQSMFDHVIANPPFFDRKASTPAQTPNREHGRGEDTPFDVWIDVAARRLRPGGYLTLIQRAARLSETLSFMGDRLGSIEIVPLTSRAGRDAENIIVIARKGGRTALRLHFPVILHDGKHHDRDRDSYSEQAQSILRHGGPLVI